ncbi:MAG: queA [Hydrocarboniphaga sp.]|uniref:tRNA preQ1(34) S-adenosylmethionine ribosyltransferase-isomerase QueA n=1 Tax=Hydrocarboniphaga sp. TaxID=2033016 RepID=UPI00280FB616|nr:queA [Hydrocarboniphaga sp.]
MRRSDFSYDLPAELIAQYPAERRSGSRLLDLGLSRDAGFTDRAMLDLPDLIDAGDLLIFNDTRVIPARLFGRKPSGGRVEMLIERVLDDREALAQIGASKTPKAGGLILVDAGDGAVAEIVMLSRSDDLFHLRLQTPGTFMQLLERVGRLPLPPYIDHVPGSEDGERYQTVFATQPGAVAAPTAGLHFDDDLLARLRGRGIATATLTLHVGAGTFQPLRVDDLSEHRMHAERYDIPATLVAAIAHTRAAGKRVVAVGTTVARALESAAAGDGVVRVGEGETRLFITPGYRFRIVDRLLTNFHLPESTLLMLVSAFGGYEQLMAAYRYAVAQRYRFFSYGDAMLITRAG